MKQIFEPQLSLKIVIMPYNIVVYEDVKKETIINSNE